MSRWMQVGIVMTAFAVLLCGCAQNTQTPTEQKAQQITPTQTKTEQAALGNTYNIYVVNGPGKDTGPASGNPQLSALGQRLAADQAAKKLNNGTTTDGGNSCGDASAGFVQLVSVNVAGTANPSAAGNTSGSGAQTASPSTETTAKQRNDPSVSAQLGAAAPGGAVSQQSTPVSGAGQASGQTMTTTNDLKTQLNDIQGQIDKMGQAIDAIKQGWQQLLPTSQKAPD